MLGDSCGVGCGVVRQVDQKRALKSLIEAERWAACAHCMLAGRSIQQNRWLKSGREHFGCAVHRWLAESREIHR